MNDPTSAPLDDPSSVDPAAAPPTKPALPAHAEVSRRPDPGSRYASMLATIGVLIAMPVVVFLQQCGPRDGPAPAAPSPSTSQAGALGGTPETDQFSMVGRMMVKMYHFFKGAGTSNDAKMMAQTLGTQLDGAANPGQSPFAIVKPDPLVVRLNKVRNAIAAAELEGGEEALRRINELATEPPPETEPEIQTPKPDAGAPEPSSEGGAAPDAPESIGPSLDISADLEPLRLIYSGHAAELTDEQRSTLLDRHGWWGKLALSHGLPDTDPARAPLIGGGGRLMAVLFFVGIAVLLGIVGAITCFIVMLVKLAGGSLRRRFAPPARGGSVYLETLAIFIACFAAMQVGGGLAVKHGFVPEGLMRLVPWLLLLVLLWPLARGVSFAEHRRLIGWHSGRGVLREIGCGVLGYFAGLVPFFCATIISIVLLFGKMAFDKAAGRESVPPRNPVLEELMKGSVWEIVVLAALATIWAPIVEEAVFRGSYYRHLRSRLSVLGAAAISAVVFGFMHPYPVFLLLPVITLGFVFALMREWRGSLIAPMTAHALHNGTLVGMLILVLSVMRD